jgi:uncharacterized protein involved in exopolysaccharide biosynthesis
LVDTALGQSASPGSLNLQASAEQSQSASTSFRQLCRILWRHRILIGIIEGSLLALCGLYCLIAPNQYEATARVELRTAPASSLNLESNEPFASASILSAPMALETLAGVLRSDQLAWRVITGLRLYQAPGFCRNFSGRFPGFRADAPGPEAQAWLLERFSRRLNVQTIPRTLLVEVRFRSHDPVLSASVVNALISAYSEQENESQVRATAQASGWLTAQLAGLKDRVDRDQQRLADFESRNGIVSTPELVANGLPGETEHSSALLEIDELGRQLVAATTDRILSEAEYRAASQGDPEMVIAADPRLQSEGNNFATALLQQIHARRSDLEQEQAQLSAEHGPSFPRVVEIGRQIQNLDTQKQAEDAKLVDRFRSNWQTALDREQLVRKSLDQVTGEGMKLNEATTQYAVMRQEANASHDLYLRVQEKAEEAGLAAGLHTADISVVDPARQPVKPVAPDPPLYFAITLFVGLWIAAGAALLRETFSPSVARVATLLFAFLAAGSFLHAQAPTPSTSGLPAGVASFPQSQETKSLPSPKEAPALWNNSGVPAQINALQSGPPQAPMPAPIAPGDVLDISESHTPEFHSTVRVSPEGIVTLPMIGVVNVAGMDEQAAAQAIDAALLAKGMLLHRPLPASRCALPDRTRQSVFADGGQGSELVVATANAPALHPK